MCAGTTDANARHALKARIDQFVRNGWQVVERTDNPPAALLVTRESQMTSVLALGDAPRSSGPRRSCRRVWIGSDGQTQWENVPCPPAVDPTAS